MRTYYLGLDGRVSQRKHLVGTVIATTRATTTGWAVGYLTAGLVCNPYPIRFIIRPYIKPRKTA